MRIEQATYRKQFDDTLKQLCSDLEKVQGDMNNMGKAMANCKHDLDARTRKLDAWEVDANKTQQADVHAVTSPQLQPPTELGTSTDGTAAVEWQQQHQHALDRINAVEEHLNQRLHTLELKAIATAPGKQPKEAERNQGKDAQGVEACQALGSPGTLEAKYDRLQTKVMANQNQHAADIEDFRKSQESLESRVKKHVADMELSQQQLSRSRDSFRDQINSLQEQQRPINESIKHIQEIPTLKKQLIECRTAHDNLALDYQEHRSQLNDCLNYLMGVHEGTKKGKGYKR